jgi:hypothetical protein
MSEPAKCAIRRWENHRKHTTDWWLLFFSVDPQNMKVVLNPGSVKLWPIMQDTLSNFQLPYIYTLGTLGGFPVIGSIKVQTPGP